MQVAVKDEVKNITQQVLAAFETVSKSIALNELTQKELYSALKKETSTRNSKTRKGLDSDVESTAEERIVVPIEQPKPAGKLPQEVYNHNLSKAQLQRLNVVYEYIDTEQDYVRDLGVIISVCRLTPMHFPLTFS